VSTLDPGSHFGKFSIGVREQCDRVNGGFIDTLLHWQFARGAGVFSFHAIGSCHAGASRIGVLQRESWEQVKQTHAGMVRIQGVQVARGVIDDRDIQRLEIQLPFVSFVHLPEIPPSFLGVVRDGFGIFMIDQLRILALQAQGRGRFRGYDRISLAHRIGLEANLRPDQFAERSRESGFPTGTSRTTTLHRNRDRRSGTHHPHHDHIGIAPERDGSGDNIYNGAIDNASGTAALLTILKAISESHVRPNRSLMFVAVGAEEQGLLGSKYLAENPIVPNGKLAALVNIDGINFLGPTRDVQVIGLGKSSMDALVEAARLQAIQAASSP